MRRGEIPAALLNDVKRHLHITWTDEATDANVRGFIASGTVYIDGFAGEPQDYDEDGEARTLLMEYCRYVRDEALDVFENNYQHLLLHLQQENEAMRHVEKTLTACPVDQSEL